MNRGRVTVQAGSCKLSSNRIPQSIVRCKIEAGINTSSRSRYTRTIPRLFQSPTYLNNSLLTLLVTLVLFRCFLTTKNGSIDIQLHPDLLFLSSVTLAPLELDQNLLGPFPSIASRGEIGGSECKMPNKPWYLCGSGRFVDWRGIVHEVDMQRESLLFEFGNSRCFLCVSQ
jgi:hypothetical protein